MLRLFWYTIVTLIKIIPRLCYQVNCIKTDVNVSMSQWILSMWQLRFYHVLKRWPNLHICPAHLCLAMIIFIISASVYLTIYHFCLVFHFFLYLLLFLGRIFSKMCSQKCSSYNFAHIISLTLELVTVNNRRSKYQF